MPLGRETRKHPAHRCASSPQASNGSVSWVPILIDSATRVVAGWGLVQAARQLGHTEVPAICVTDLPETELRARFHRDGGDTSVRRAPDGDGVIMSVDSLTMQFGGVQALDDVSMPPIGYPEVRP